MKTIKELIYQYMKTNNMTRENAASYVCQQILIDKISSSNLVDKVLLKGGVVMYNMTKNARRATRDMDFDLVRYDIKSEKSLGNLIKCFNKRYPEYQVIMTDHQELRQDDYHGVKLFLDIKDKSMKVAFTVDIGIHTLSAINQKTTVFEFPNCKNKLLIRTNPPEQIIAEKLYALAKIGATTKRIRDIYDIFYLLKNCKINHKICRQCLELLTHDKKHNLNDIEDVSNQINDILEDKVFAQRVDKSKLKWLDASFNVIKEEILNFLYNL